MKRGEGRERKRGKERGNSGMCKREESVVSTGILS